MTAGAGDRVAAPEVVEALARWGVEPRYVETLRGGAANEHWRVEGGPRPFVLRRYHPRHTPEDVAYEHNVLDRLAGRSWPVAAPLPALEGGTLAVTAAGAWSLFPRLTGEPPPSDPLSLQRKGAVLALLHADLAEIDPGEQRSGFGRVTELDPYVGADGFAGVGALLEWYRARDAARAGALSEALDRTHTEVRLFGYGDLPEQLVYYECLGNNVLFQGDTVTALLDWDLTHRDARVADIARALLVDCGTDGERVGVWVGGYASAADPALSPLEATVIPALMIASELWNTVLPLSIAARWGGGTVGRTVVDSIDERLPRLAAARAGLGRVVRAAAGS